MKAYVGKGGAGRFAGLWSVMVNAAFSYGGVEMVAVAAGEAANPRKNIPKAVNRVFWRILVSLLPESVPDANANPSSSSSTCSVLSSLASASVQAIPCSPTARVLGRHPGSSP